jgi:hypothetical protein
LLTSKDLSNDKALRRRPLRLADNPLLERRHANPPLKPIRGVLGAQLVGNAIHLGLRPRERDARFQAPQRSQVIALPLIA